MKSQEKPEIPAEICPTCYNPKSAHAADCDYEEKVRKHNEAEGITPEFEAGVKSGAITYEKQMQEVAEFLESLRQPLPKLSRLESEENKSRFGNAVAKFEEGRNQVLSYDAGAVKEALVIDSSLIDLMDEIRELDKSIIMNLRQIAEHPADDPEVTSAINDLEIEVENFKELVSEFEKKFKSFNH